MPSTNIDLVLAIDSSHSMLPCLDGLRAHLGEFLDDLQISGAKVRLGLVTLAIGEADDGGRLISMQTLDPQGIFAIYQNPPSSKLFTTDRSEVIQTMSKITPSGDEDNIFLLDCACDMPFGEVTDTRRVIALFSDEPLEDGRLHEQSLALIPDLCLKIMARRIKLFAAMPDSDAAGDLAAGDGVDIIPVQGGDGLASVDMGKLLTSLSKTISVESRQAEDEPSWQRALFGQDRLESGTGKMTGA